MPRYSGERLVWVRRAVALATASIACAVLWNHVSEVDAFRAIALLTSVGPEALLLILPVLIATLADTLGWYFCIPGGHRNVRFLRLFLIRWGTDVLSTSLPGGVLAGETLRPLLLHRIFDLPATDAVASSVIMKGGIAVAQTMFFAAVGFLSAGVLDGFSAYVPAALAVGCAGVGLILMPRYVHVSDLLFRVGSGGATRWRMFVTRVAPRVKEIENAIGDFAVNHPARLMGALAMFFIGWIAIASEAYLVLMLLGTDASFGSAMRFEMIASLIRMGFFFVPAGVGVQEVGVTGLVNTMGFDDPLPLAAAFILLKRLRELCWVVPGALVLVQLKR